MLLLLLLLLLLLFVVAGGTIDRRRDRDGEIDLGAAHLLLSADRNGIVGDTKALTTKHGEEIDSSVRNASISISNVIVGELLYCDVHVVIVHWTLIRFVHVHVVVVVVVCGDGDVLCCCWCGGDW